MIPREPTADECSTHADLGDGWTAIWYPQMGGYVGKAAAFIEDECFEVYVWHDGEFPFSCGQTDRDVPASPVRLHHCDADQFISFGEELKRLQEKK